MREEEVSTGPRCAECGGFPRRPVEVERWGGEWTGWCCWPCLRRARRRVDQMHKEREVG